MVCSEDEQNRFYRDSRRVEPGQDRSHAGDVETPFAGGLAHAPDDVLYVGGI